jgi:hypothetical protein
LGASPNFLLRNDILTNPSAFKKLLYVVLAMVCTACNLQTQPPVTLTSEPTAILASQTPALSPTSGLAPLQATPTQLPLFGGATATINILVTPGGGTVTSATGAATLDAALFDGRFEVEARTDGETIGIVYDVTVFRGSILMVLQGANGIVWQKTLTTSEASRADVPVAQAGVYELLIDAQNLSGEYQFRFE